MVDDIGSSSGDSLDRSQALMTQTWYCNGCGQNIDAVAHCLPDRVGQYCVDATDHGV
eukprot:SAG25_NODE_5883_length_609_cov_1.417647_2_plen_56_part_01